MTYKLNEVDVDRATDQELQPVLEVVNQLEREQDPRSSGLTVDELRVFSHEPGTTQQHVMITTPDGDIAGMGGWSYPSDGSNESVLHCMLGVVIEHRRNGVGRMLLEYLTESAENLRRSKLIGWHFDTVPAGADFVRAIGARTGDFAFHRNVVRVADIDRSLMERWARIGEERAPGYSMHLHEGLLPEELLEDMAHLHRILDRDMPRAEEMKPRKWTAESYDEFQRHFGKESEALTAIAIHDADGQAVGMSQIVRRKSDPKTWLVTVTMVDREHRGHSLGKWVKGTVNVAALDQWDGGEYQETNNAFSNEAMLAINRQMGFVHERSMFLASLDVTDARAYLMSRRDR